MPEQLSRHIVATFRSSYVILISGAFFTAWPDTNGGTSKSTPIGELPVRFDAQIAFQSQPKKQTEVRQTAAKEANCKHEAVASLEAANGIQFVEEVNPTSAAKRIL
jgi:hypothetical protein